MNELEDRFVPATLNDHITLPDKPSELIRLALRDLFYVAYDPDYAINMNYFHTGCLDPAWDGKCQVCFAGAVMAKTLNVPVDRHAIPEDFDDDTNYKLDALDSFRDGLIDMGLDVLGLRTPEGMESARDIEVFRDNPMQFHDDMESLANDLEGYGL